MSDERTYSQAEVDAILKAAFPLSTPQERWENLARAVEAARPQPTLIERLLMWAAHHDGGPDALNATTAGDLMKEAADAIPRWRALNAIGGEESYRNGESILIRRPDARHQKEDGWHVARWDIGGNDWPQGGWLIHDGRTDHLLQGPEPTLWMPLPLD